MKITVGQLVGIVVVIIVIAVGAYFATNKVKNGTAGSGKTRQAVFLNNGQVYFGYVSGSLGSKQIVVRDIYYLQVQQALQPSGSTNSNEQPQVSLVKLGNELHGPQDEMKINTSQITYIEDMKNDSKVNQAITEYIKNGATPVATPTPAS